LSVADPRRGLPFIWVTWMTGLLSGADSCEWAPWFQSRFTFDKVTRDFDLIAWTADHGEMVRARVEQLRAEGYTVYVEDQNKFTLKGRTATLSGKADIVAVRGDERRVIDCKTGRESDEHAWQVMTYMFALPLVGHPAVPLKSSLVGEIQYKHRSIVIQPAEFQADMRDRILATVNRIGRQDAPLKTPSFRECSSCAIPKTECAARIETEPATALTTEF
jgi:CRISPR/Cas system-associated exonuclease Cas4 (RecB family)